MNFKEKLLEIKRQNLYRVRKTLASAQSNKISIDNKEVLNFSSNDYLSLANHPKIKEAFIKGVEKYGAGSGASHLVSGHFDIHEELESKLATYTGQDRALVFSSGFSANLGIFSALSDQVEWVLQDKLNHASLIDANHLIQKRVERYKHNDIVSLKNKISKKIGSGLIATDNVFSMDGDVAEINQLDLIAKSHESIMMQDDAHGFGVFQPNIPDNSIYMATLGKSAGTMGAFISGSKDLIDLIIQRGRSYIYTTALPPAISAASIASLELIIEGEQTRKLHENIRFFKDYSKKLKINLLESDSGIQPILIGDNKKVIDISGVLFSKGFNVGAIRSPTVPNGTERLRITLSADHSQDQISSLLETLSNAL